MTFQQWLYLPLTWQDVASTGLFYIFVVSLIVGWRLTRKK